MNKVKRVLVAGNRTLSGVEKLSQEIKAFLAPHVDAVRIVLDMTRDFSRSRADLVVVLGGDGSILRLVSQLGRNPIPVVGIQMGRFGFLSELTRKDWKGNLRKVVSGRASVEQRMMLQCTVRNRRKVVFTGTALNDAVLTSRSISRMVLIDLFVDGAPVTTFHGDGVIVATPVGSTAHSLSTGGPIVEPGMNSYVISPICSHSLTIRPIVISALRRIEFRMRESRYPLVLTLDGQRTHKLKPDEKIFVRKAAHSLNLVKVTERSYFDTLRLKFNWGGTSLDNCCWEISPEGSKGSKG